MTRIMSLLFQVQLWLLNVEQEHRELKINAHINCMSEGTQQPCLFEDDDEMIPRKYC
jgi:hypothetical protein